MPTAEQEQLSKIQAALAKPFDESEIKWKPQVTKKKDGSGYFHGQTQVAGCTAHIDARAVMNRLDEVVGSFEWSDSYLVLPGGKNVECILTVRGVSKTDVGEVNADGFADPLKTAYSDALKRAAVKFGIGRHLYDMEMIWLPFDGYKILDQSPKLKKHPENKNKPPRPQAPSGDTPEDQILNHKPAPEKAQVGPQSDSTAEPNGSGNGKLMSAEKYREWCAKEYGYEDPEHVFNTMKLMGFDRTPMDKETRKRLAEALAVYRVHRKKGLSQDDALAEVDAFFKEPAEEGNDG